MPFPQTGSSCSSGETLGMEWKEDWKVMALSTGGTSPDIRIQI